MLPFLAMFAVLATLMSFAGCATLGTGTGGNVLAAVDEGVQKVQWLKPVVDGIFSTLCAASPGGGVVGAGACAAYPLISAGAGGALALAQGALQSAREDATPLNQQTVTARASELARIAAILAELYKHPEMANQLAAPPVAASVQ